MLSTITTMNIPFAFAMYIQRNTTYLGSHVTHGHKIPHTLADRVARPRTGRAGQGQLGHPSVPAWAQQADSRLSAARRRMLGPKRARSTGSIQSRTAASRSSAIILPPPGGKSHTDTVTVPRVYVSLRL